MPPTNSLLSLIALIALIIFPPQNANADLVVSEDLGVLEVGSSTPFGGNTAEGENNADTYLKTGTIVSYGNEIVFQFTIECHAHRRSGRFYIEQSRDGSHGSGSL